MVDALLKARTPVVLAAVFCLITIVAVSDWAVGNTFSLGIFYILPMMLGALVLRLPATAALALFCAFLRSRFDVPATRLETVLRFAFASFTYFASALMVTALVRNRKLVSDHLAETQQNLMKLNAEQRLRYDAEERLRALVASSPAAILTLDSAGRVIATNDAANALFGLPDGATMLDRLIVDHLPVLADALALANAPDEFRTAAQCQGRRADGQVFLAHTWFSSYSSPAGRHLAAIVVDSSEEMREREQQSLRHLQESNRITAAAVSHELRNLCSAILLVCSQVGDKYNLTQHAEFRGLKNLVSGLDKLVSRNLQLRANQLADFGEVSLRRVLDDLRIVIQSEWEEIGGTVRWPDPYELPFVVGESHGLLQVLLNLAQNSHRAVQQVSIRELDIIVSTQEDKALIRFRDTGAGVSHPERLFQPFQEEADGSGLGLYVSRALVRSYGGDLRFESVDRGTCFAIELLASNASE